MVESVNTSINRPDLIFSTVLRFDLQVSINLHQRAFFDFEPTLDRIEEKREFSPASRIQIGCTLYLPLG